MIRACLAIDLPASLRPGLARVQDELKKCGADVKWVPVGNVHLTLKFFGQIPESQVLDICQAAGEIARWQPPFTLKVAGAGAFPSNKNPRVVWLGVHGDLDVLPGFVRQLETAFAGLGFTPEDRPFSAHLTLGRVRSPAGRTLFDEMARRVQGKGYEWADLSLTSDDNPATPELAERMGARVYKRYRVYRRPI